MMDPQHEVNEMTQDELFDDEIFVLTDEDGKEIEFALLGSCTLDDKLYLALIPADEADNPNSEYVIMKAETDENGEDVLCTIEDDDEFERIAEIFDDQLFDEEEEDVE
jgi:uncharacterized protein YrzB (UPF0473 family)